MVGSLLYGLALCGLGFSDLGWLQVMMVALGVFAVLCASYVLPLMVDLGKGMAVMSKAAMAMRRLTCDSQEAAGTESLMLSARDHSDAPRARFS